MTIKKFKTPLKKYISLTLSLMLLLGHLSLFAVAKDEAFLAVPEYVNRLSKLVEDTSSENDFALIELKIDDPEMVIDGQEQPISTDGSVTPVIENGELAIPEAVIAAVSDTPEVRVNGSADEDLNRKLTQPELEALGYDVEYNEENETVFITEPFQQMRLLVRTATGRVSQTYGATDVINVSNNVTVLQYDSKEKAKSAYERFNKDPKALICAPDALIYVEEFDGQEAAQEVEPQDEEESPYKCWGTVRVGADRYMENLPDADEMEEIVIALIDTGVDIDHPFLEGRLKEGWDFIHRYAAKVDLVGHGTHCAGIIKDATKENVKIMPLKVCDTMPYIMVSIAFEAINYAIDAGADILSMSFGGFFGEKKGVEMMELLEIAFARADDNGAISVAAAGNESLNLERRSYPRYPAIALPVITVSSCNEENEFSYFSNYGEAINICAPGENILSSVPDGGFEELSGTSMSTPLVSAAAALVKSGHPDYTVNDVKNWLYCNATDMGEPGWDEYYGAGILCLTGEDPAGEYEYKFNRPVESLSFAEESFEIAWGEISTLHLRLAPDVPADYLKTAVTVSDETVVHIIATSVLTEQVVIIGLKPGTVIVTAAYSNDSGTFTDSVTVTVKYRDNLSVGIDHFIFNEVLYKFGERSEELIPLRDEEDNKFTGVEKCSQYYLIKTDGTLWVRDRSYFEVNKEPCPVRATDAEGVPLTSKFVDVCGRTVLTSEGTVWVRENRYDDTVLKQLLKEDGTPLTGVKKITSNTAVTEDGYAYYVDSVFNCAMTINYDDGKPFSDIAEAYYLSLGAQHYGTYTVVLRTDGTVWVKGFNEKNRLGTSEIREYANSGGFIPVKISYNQYLNNVKQILFADPEYNETGMHIPCSYTTYALCSDGSLWAWGGFYDESVTGDKLYGFLGIGEYDNSGIYVSRVKTDENTYLEDVYKIIDAGNCRMCCALRDGSVWQTGRIDAYDYLTDTYTEYVLYAEPMKFLGDTIRLEGREYELPPELILLEDSGMVTDENRESIYGVPAGMRVDDFEALFNVSNDGYVEIAAPGRYVGTGSLLIVHDSHGEAVAEYTVVVFGDLDGNGRVTAADVAIAKQALVDGFEDEVFEFAANIVKTTKRNKFNAADVSALMSALTDDPIDQAEIAQVYAANGW